MELLGSNAEYQPVVAVYGGYLALTRLMPTALLWYVTSEWRRLVDVDLDPGTIRLPRARVGYTGGILGLEWYLFFRHNPGYSLLGIAGRRRLRTPAHTGLQSLPIA